MDYYKIYFSIFLKICPENLRRKIGTLHEDLCAFMTIPPPVLKMKTVSDGSCRKTQKH
jgi:hypothetical protein